MRGRSVWFMKEDGAPRSLEDEATARATKDSSKSHCFCLFLGE